MYNEYGEFMIAATLFAGFKWIVFAIIAILLIQWLASTVVITRGASAKIVEFLGKPSRQARKAGLSFKAPWPLAHVVGTVNLQLRELSVAEEIRIKSEGSDGFVHLPVKVQYHVNDDIDGLGPVIAHYRMRNPEEQMKSYLGLSIKASANGSDLMELFGDRDAIENKVLHDLQEKFGQFGFKIENVLVDAPRLPEGMKTAFNEVIQAEQVKRAAKSLAEADRTRLVGRAQAEKESKKLQGEGMADMRRAIAHGMKESIEEATKSGITHDHALALLMDTNRLDTLNTAASHGNLVIVDMKSSSDVLTNALVGTKAGLSSDNVTALPSSKSAA